MKCDKPFDHYDAREKSSVGAWQYLSGEQFSLVAAKWLFWPKRFPSVCGPLGV
jgi:hypothetical protein